ncbi:MAG: DUF1273 domain-containing protein [Clostridiales bacterium]|nr:DUF1273 domain-containing protein [Clostridiales bacterium]
MIDNLCFREKVDFDIQKSVCFTGHRQVDKDFDYKNFENLLEKLIEKGYEYFFIGMALGFDTICFRLLEGLRESYKHIKLIACIPCKDQDKKFNVEQKQIYKNMVDNADYKVLISQSYTPYCMQERNAFMVDNSSLVIAYMLRNYGGTFNTVSYALRTGKKVYNIVNR